jgi:tight adherence protein B
VLPGPVVLDLVAAVLAAGAPLGTALDVVAQAAAQHDDPWTADCLRHVARQHDLGLDLGRDPGDRALPGWVRELGEAVGLAREAGVAAGPLLVAAAAQERRRAVAVARVAAARLAVQVVLPTGLCLLPAFVLLAVVPLVLGLLGVG